VGDTGGPGEYLSPPLYLSPLSSVYDLSTNVSTDSEGGLRAGGWEHGAWATTYLARLPRHYMRVVAGFGSAKGTYFLRRS
jgi:hypothetical protein